MSEQGDGSVVHLLSVNTQQARIKEFISWLKIKRERNNNNSLQFQLVTEDYFEGQIDNPLSLNLYANQKLNKAVDFGTIYQMVVIYY